MQWDEVAAELTRPAATPADIRPELLTAVLALLDVYGTHEVMQRWLARALGSVVLLDQQIAYYALNTGEERQP